MYTALAIMFAGILIGRLFRYHISLPLVHRLTNAAILLLLFLLGVSIGKNSGLLAKLPVFGAQALILTLMGLAGSIACSVLLVPFFRDKGTVLRRKADKGD